ncbi:LEPR-XLL domain-containing protein [Streptomyces sp. NPDC058632]
MTGRGGTGIARGALTGRPRLLLSADPVEQY